MQPKTVVIFDDEMDIREVLKYNLGKEGFNVITFPSPVYGYEFIQENIPDVILTDWLMPDMNGLDFCKKLRQDNALHKIPLIMISCKGNEEDIVTALNYGADDYMVKPFRIKELVARINRIIESREFLTTDLS